VLDSVRVRLTLWYSVVLACTLLLLSGIVYWIVARSLMVRTDADLTQLADAFLVTFADEMKDAENPGGFARAADQSMLEHRYRDHLFAIADSSGAILAKSPDALFSSPHSQSDAPRILSSEAFGKFAKDSWATEHAFDTLYGRRATYRAYSRRFSIEQQAYQLVILRSLHAQNEMLQKLRLAFAWLIPVGLAWAATGGYFLTRKTLGPVAAMGAQAGRITAANLHERLSVQNPADELGRLASSFNSLLDRLDQSFERQRRFIADASHELRTPVAILSGEAEVALSRSSRTAEEYRESLANLHSEAKRLARIVDDLFTLTRADSGQYPLSPQDFYLDELVAGCVHSARTLALAKNIAVTHKNSGELPIRADESLLRRLFLNLIDNAVKYTPPGGRITVESLTVPGGYEVKVTDTGPGIPQELRSRIFERFFRVDPARSRAAKDGGGAGLGLSIALWIAEAHHGRLELARSDSSGSTFFVFLPAPTSPSASSSDPSSIASSSPASPAAR
jgi:two-component system, OmpR family, sensor kinase